MYPRTLALHVTQEVGELSQAYQKFPELLRGVRICFRTSEPLSDITAQAPGSRNHRCFSGPIDSQFSLANLPCDVDAKRDELLVSHTYPYAPFEQFRTCCDFVNLLFVVDEVSDEQDGYNARVTGEIFLNSMRYPDWDDGSALAKMTREYVPGTYLIHSVTELIFLCISPVLQSRRRPSCPLRHLLLLRARDA